MKKLTRVWLFASAILIFGSVTSVAQSRIQMVQGRRAVTDKVIFVVEVGREKTPNPRYATAPEDMIILTRFSERPATGMVYMDGKALGRFDESMSFHSTISDVTYGRHTITMTFTNPAVVTDLTVMVRGGVVREILEGESTILPPQPDLERRLMQLERKVQDLESEIAILRKKPAQ